MKKTSEVILDALALLDDRSRWTKGAIARNANSLPVMVDSQNACKFCSIGALTKANGNESHSLAEQTMQRALTGTGYGGSIIGYNDSAERKHKQVVELFMTGAFLALAQETVGINI